MVPTVVIAQLGVDVTSMDKQWGRLVFIAFAVAGGCLCAWVMSKKCDLKRQR